MRDFCKFFHDCLEFEDEIIGMFNIFILQKTIFFLILMIKINYLTNVLKTNYVPPLFV